jgi:hypothetical protein
VSERCETCRFWKDQIEDLPRGRLGLCRRNSPQGTSSIHTDWCGEWKPQPPEMEDADLSLDEIRAAMRRTSFDGVMAQERPGPDGYPCRLRDRPDLPRRPDKLNGPLVRVECLTCGEQFQEGGIYPCMRPQPDPLASSSQ